MTNRVDRKPAHALIVACLAAGALQPIPLDAQQGQGWDSPRVLELIAQARQRRAEPYRDSALVNYRANAGGYIYFYLDREDTDERTLVKVDQVALEVYWAYPGSTRQRIVGLRDESLLPNRMRYHLDHLTVVQNEFGDRIQLGDGDEVRSVVHPIAWDSDEVYDFRLADSLTMRLGGLPEPLRVYEVEVRPVDRAAPGIVGSVFLDAATSDIVRMDFTFTRSSYVDRRLDYIRISLENGLWQGRFWLPFEQRAELRRQVPELDFPAGAIIRAHMRVRDYEFNLPLPPNLFRGPTVSAVPQAQRESFPFDEELFAELGEQGLEADPDLEALRREAAELVGRRFLDGLPRLRLDLQGASGVLRFDRTERLHLGAGLSYRATADAVLRAGVGYATGTEEPSGRLGARIRLGDAELEAEGVWNQPRDLGYQSIAGLMNTLGALAAEAGMEIGHDYHDSYFVRGGRLALGMPAPVLSTWRLGAELSMYEELDARSLIEGYLADPDDELNRPLARIEEGVSYEGLVSLHRVTPHGLARGWDLNLDAGYGFIAIESPLMPRDNLTYGIARLDWRGRIGDIDRDWVVDGRVRLGMLLGYPPAQRHFMLGGRATVPGYAYRSFVGDRSALLEVTGRRVLLRPWLTGRLSTAIGWTGMAGDPALADWPTATGSVGPSVGVGIGLVHDILWLDLHRGLDGGDWELLLSVDRRLWDIL